LPGNVIIDFDFGPPVESLEAHSTPYPEPSLLGEQLIPPKADTLRRASPNQQKPGDDTWYQRADPRTDQPRPEKHMREHYFYVAPLLIIEADEGAEASWSVTDGIGLLGSMFVDGVPGG
jgi:hypothetical protein